MSFLNIVLNILTSALPCSLLAVGIFITYRLLDFADLTAEGSFLLGACVTAAMIHSGLNPFLATICGTLTGTLCGILTGILNRYLKIPKLLSGIITLTASGSIALLIMGTTSSISMFATQVPINVKEGGKVQTIFSLFYPWMNPWNRIVEAGILILIVALVIVIVYYFFGTEYGMSIRATGMNEKMARAQGINTTFATIVGVAISNTLIGLGGALFVQDSLAVSTTFASGYLVIGLASILIGEAIFGKRSFKNWLISVSLGAIVYFIITTIVIQLGFPTQLKNLLYAILITIALCIPFFKKWISSLKNKKKVEVNES